MYKRQNVSCDELITGHSPQPPQPDGLEAVKELLAEKQRREKRRSLWRMCGAGALTVCLVCAGAYGAGRIAELRSQVNGLSQQIAQIQGDMNHSIGNIRSEIQESLEQQASIVADWNFSYGDYDHKTKTVEVFARATPKTWVAVSYTHLAPAPVEEPAVQPAAEESEKPEETPVDLEANPKAKVAVEYLKEVAACMGATKITVEAVRQGETCLLYTSRCV